jgi:MSHA biogenesis protein MshJ
VKAALRRYAERIDSATLRERALLFGAAALILIYLVIVALINPLRDTQRRLGADIAQKEQELRTVQAEIQRMARAQDADPDAQNRKRASELRAQIATLDAKLATEQQRFTSPEQMRRVLHDMLERNKRLRLVDLKTLPIQDLAPSQTAAARRVFRHGVELTLAGSYLDLHAYLAALEGNAKQLYWGRAEMSVTGYPVASLKLVVYTLSLDEAWLVV